MPLSIPTEATSRPQCQHRRRSLERQSLPAAKLKRQRTIVIPAGPAVPIAQRDAKAVQLTQPRPQ